MTETTCHMAISLDGFVAGPAQSPDEPIGIGGMKLHDWHLQADDTGDEADLRMRALLLRPRGAYIMGRNMFGPIRGPWRSDPWSGWWGDDPPYHVPTFVLTHHPREPQEMEGGTTFFFVTDGILPAFDQAQHVAGDKDVLLGGGASVIQQNLAAGLIDEFWLHVVPILLGDGERLLENVGELKLEQVRAVEAPGVTHIKYRVVRG